MSSALMEYKVYTIAVMTTRASISWVVVLAACTEPPVEPRPPLPAGVVFTYPADGQLDVPTGARIVVSFSAPMAGDAIGAIRLVGPTGPVAVTAVIAGGGRSVAIATPGLEPGATYEMFVDGSATPRFRFTTRDDRPRAGPPYLVAIDGADPAEPAGAFRPIVETSTLQLVFSEPLDPRSVGAGPGAIELVDVASGAAVPARVLADRIHAAVDPVAPLVAGAAYELRLGEALRDLGGEPLVPATIPFTPLDSIGRGTIDQTLRVRRAADPVAAIARLDASNVIDLAHPLIGGAASNVASAAVTSELGDPAALGGPIAFTIPRGQRLASSALDIQLAGAIRSGLTTGDIVIELLADANGRLARNRFRPADALPDNEASPLHVDLALDLAVFASDPTGNAVLAQSLYGVQMSGVAMADEGTLAIEVQGAIDIDLLGIATAPANLVLDLVSDPAASAPVDVAAPVLADLGPRELFPDDGIVLQLDEPIDVDRAVGGGITLVDATGAEVPCGIEIAGSAVVVRPRAALPDGARFDVVLSDVADVAGNAMAPAVVSVATPAMPPTTAPLSVVSAHPGTACVRVDPTTAAPGRCAGGLATDDAYRPFALAAGEPVEVVFDQAVDPASLVLGAACGDGSVRVEHLDTEGRCLGTVAGALVPRPRGLAFVPDVPWTPGDPYRVLLVSGPDAACGAGEICGRNRVAASFDALAGGKAAGDGGGPDLMIDFVGAEPGGGTRLFAEASPYGDTNASGELETGEAPRDENRAALRISGTSGLVTGATFPGPDCVPGTPEVEACMYMLGGMPATLGAIRTGCALPDGTTADVCIPVELSAQQLYATSVTMTAAALGIPITTETGISVMRVREPADGPLEGFIVERDGAPVMVVALDLYLDAPDMALPIGTHDVHSKPLAILLSGPVTFRPDGRIAITLANTADVPIDITITALPGLGGGVALVLPAGELRLQLLSPARRSGR
jgi:hypothetical protein